MLIADEKPELVDSEKKKKMKKKKNSKICFGYLATLNTPSPVGYLATLNTPTFEVNKLGRR